MTDEALGMTDEALMMTLGGSTEGGFLVGAEEGGEVAVKDGFGVAGLEAGAVVLHHLVGVEYVGADLVAPTGRDVLALEARLLLGLALHFELQEAGFEDLERQVLVAALGALVLTADGDAGRDVGDADGGGVLLYVLATVTAGAEDVYAEIVGAEVDLGGAFDFGQDLDEGEGGVAGGGGIGGGGGGEGGGAPAARAV